MQKCFFFKKSMIIVKSKGFFIKIPDAKFNSSTIFLEAKLCALFTKCLANS